MYEIAFPTAEVRKKTAQQARKRVAARQLRLAKRDQIQPFMSEGLVTETDRIAINAARAAEIAAAVARVKEKKRY